jgi:hypothetical protein
VSDLLAHQERLGAAHRVKALEATALGLEHRLQPATFHVARQRTLVQVIHQSTTTITVRRGGVDKNSFRLAVTTP